MFLTFLSCVVCKATHGILRLLKRGGTSLPGVLALKICPDILERLSKNVNVIALTGTNGKTTSARMLEKSLQNAGKKVFSNRSGANLIAGITTEFIMNANVFGKPGCDWAVIECDEATTPKVFPAIKPKAVILTNLFRDQTDRYGGVLAPRDMIAEALKNSPDTVVCINADCPLTSSVADMIDNKKVFFGMDCARAKKIDETESLECPVCGGRMNYSYATYSNLGGFACSKCGAHRHDADVAIKELLGANTCKLSVNGEMKVCEVKLPGVYNMYNAAGTIAAMAAAGLETGYAFDAVKDFDCGFGRMERFDLGKKGAQMLLIKNTAAVNQTLEYIAEQNGGKTLVFTMNNRAADGRDPGWLEDANFELLAEDKSIREIIVGGEIEKLLAARIKKAGLECRVENNYDRLIAELEDKDDRIYIMPSYTAMLDLRQKLVNKLGGKNFWE